MTYIGVVSDVGQEISVGHVWQDDEGHVVHAETDPDQRENVGVLEILHDQGLVQETLHINVARTVLWKYKELR
jgi:hypothetical protein